MPQSDEEAGEVEDPLKDGQDDYDASIRINRSRHSSIDRPVW
jgi:hypothetical protein